MTARRAANTIRVEWSCSTSTLVWPRDLILAIIQTQWFLLQQQPLSHLSKHSVTWATKEILLQYWNCARSRRLSSFGVFIEPPHRCSGAAGGSSSCPRRQPEPQRPSAPPEQRETATPGGTSAEHRQRRGYGISLETRLSCRFKQTFAQHILIPRKYIFWRINEERSAKFAILTDLLAIC